MRFFHKKQDAFLPKQIWNCLGVIKIDLLIHFYIYRTHLIIFLIFIGLQN